MRYVSTRGLAPSLPFDDVLLEGLARDGGLYVPEGWPELVELPGPDASYAEVASRMIAPYVAGGVIEPVLEEMAEETYAAFRHPDVAPLRQAGDGRWVLELFWGPTLSFKDYALSLVGAMFDRVLSARDRRILVLGATSGDTGSAAIEACRDRASIDIVILFPAGRVSEIQRRQMTTVGSANVRAVAVDGTFDDCQDLVKRAFGDERLRDELGLAAVNSINWARVMAQTAYYAWACARLETSLTVAVPTGNFGNVFAAFAARRMGVPIDRMVIGNNANHGLAELVRTGRLPRGEVVPTVAPAMDIQIPSNLERYVFELSGRDGRATAEALDGFRQRGALALDELSHARMQREFSAGWSDDAAIEETISEVDARHGIVLDPHTATAWRALDEHPGSGAELVVSTAHPAKFPEAVEAATGVAPELPEDLSDLMERPERFAEIPADLGSVEDVLRSVRRV
jgi:threonine synthase